MDIDNVALLGYDFRFMPEKCSIFVEEGFEILCINLDFNEVGGLMA